MELSILLLAALLPAASLARGSSSANKKDAILLSSVETLTLRGNGAKTKHRRVPAVPQLQCISSPSLCRLVDMDVMRCTNQGSSYSDEDVEWSCTANLPDELKLGSTDVICEGYAGPDDPYVLKGSCAVEYRVALTSKGERRYPDLASESSFSGSGGFWGPLAFFVFIVFFIYMLATFCGDDRNRRRFPRTTGGVRRGGGGGGGGGGWPRGGGGGGGGWNPGSGGSYPNDPPPPYSAQPKSSSSSSTSQQQSWRPGFWSGMAAGAAGSYLASGRNRNQDRDRYQGYGGGGPSTSFWGGRRSPPAGGSGSNFSSSSGSGATHESTGFGSTRRR